MLQWAQQAKEEACSEESLKETYLSLVTVSVKITSYTISAMFSTFGKYCHSLFINSLQ